MDATEKKEFSGWSDEHKETHVVNNLSEAVKIHPKLKKILLKPGAKKKLSKYKHPKGNAVYIFGPDTGKVNIKPDIELEVGSKSELWAIQACSIVLYDRFLKGLK